MTGRIISGRSCKLVGRLARPAGFAMALACAGLVMAPAAAASPAIAVAASAAQYQTAVRPMWTERDPSAAAQLVGLIESSMLDGLDPEKFQVKALKSAVRSAARGDRQDMVRADAMLDRALVAYVTALRSTSSGEWTVVDPAAMQGAPSASSLLSQAAAAPSLDAWVEDMAFMHPDYAPLRRELDSAIQSGDEHQQALLALNLQRARLLPGGNGRFVMVNAAAQRLYIYEGGRVVDSMKVVVGKPAQPTPMMAAMIRYTAVRPYWNVPSDLVAERVAPNVVKDGLPYLKQHGYVVLSDWTDEANAVDPETIDWEAVAAGKVELRMRQNPGPSNAMGQMKFMFPNPQGVYLHDTPNKELMVQDARLFSGGCVRLEDAPRLAKWLYGHSLKVARKGEPEQHVDLDKPVPVYLAYLTAVPSGDQIVYLDDIYGRDRAQFALAGNRRIATR